MYRFLQNTCERPVPYSVNTTQELWSDEHTSKKMLEFHLNPNIDLSSRNMPFIEKSATWIADRFRFAEGFRVLDLGCGPGLYATLFAQRQADVTGVDFSQRSLAYARARASAMGLAIDYQERNYLDFSATEPFDLITLIMCDYCALSPAHRAELVGKLHALLRPGGSVLLDVYSLNAYTTRQEVAVFEKNLLDGFWAADEHFGFLNVFKYDDVKIILDKYTIVEPSRVRTFHNWLQYFEPETLMRELEIGGFVVDELLADVAGTPFAPDSLEMAIVAKRGRT